MTKSRKAGKIYARVALTAVQFQEFHDLAVALRGRVLESEKAAQVLPEKQFYRDLSMTWERLIAENLDKTQPSARHAFVLAVTEPDFKQFYGLATAERKRVFDAWVSAEVPIEKQALIDSVHAWDKLIEEKFVAVLIADTSQDSQEDGEEEEDPSDEKDD